MSSRLLLVALLVLSTTGFVVGVSVERSSGDSHDEPAASTTAPGESAEEDEERSGEGAASGELHADEADAPEEEHTEPGSDEASEEGGSDEALLGVDLEATPFVALAAALSLALAVAVWLRPGWGWLLAVIAVAMVVFAALDAREVVQQLDESNGGLAVLAGAVAALHLAAAAVAIWVSTWAVGAT